MSETRYRLKKLEKDSSGGAVPFVVLFHDDEGVFRDHDGAVHLHVTGHYWENQATDEIVMSTLFTPESLRLKI
jgi:hypothetical protein